MMDPLYDQIFNQRYVNESYLQQLQMQYHAEQQSEIAKAVKALHDYRDAARKIAPEYQQQAFCACAAAILEEIGEKKESNAMKIQLVEKVKKVITKKIEAIKRAWTYPHIRAIALIIVVFIFSGFLSFVLIDCREAAAAILASICAGCVTGIAFYVITNKRNNEIQANKGLYEGLVQTGLNALANERIESW